MTENLPGGRQVERDPETGQFKKTKLPPETAAAMGKKSGAPNIKVRQLLAEEGYNHSNPPPQYVILMAEQATKSHTALAHWRRYHQRVGGAEVEQDYTRKPADGEVCPLCNQYVGMLGMLWDAIERGE